MNQQNKKMTNRDNSTEKIKQNKSIEMWRKTKQTVPDFSGKYHGKLNDKMYFRGFLTALNLLKPIGKGE